MHSPSRFRVQGLGLVSKVLRLECKFAVCACVWKIYLGVLNLRVTPGKYSILRMLMRPKHVSWELLPWA